MLIGAVRCFLVGHVYLELAVVNLAKLYQSHPLRRDGA
jgi:hypothetical protein